MKQLKELQGKNPEELRKAVAEARKALLDLRVENGQRKLKNAHQIGAKRKEIARIKTLIRIQEITNAG